jgi:hypothetical protein
MPQEPKPRRRHHPVVHAAVEIAFIIFLFYSNLLMGEFVRSNDHHKTLRFAMWDVVTAENIKIAFISAIIGYFVFEYLRRRT